MDSTENRASYDGVNASLTSNREVSDRSMRPPLWGVATGLLCFLTVLSQTTQALPPPEDTPEEILRSEIILHGRSPIDNRPLTASQYATEQEQIAQSSVDTTIDPKIRELIFLLRLRKFLRTITPF